MDGWNDEVRAQLATVSVATLTTVLFKRGLRNAFLQDVHPTGRDLPRMVGPAYTLRYIPSREDIDGLETFADRSNPQRKGVEECPPGHVFVIDSRGDAGAASAGAILVARLWQRGAAGVVTDGGFRDTPDIAALPFPSYHRRPSSPTNLTLHHPADLQLPIGCGGVAVYPGDIVVGDGEGVIVIPRGIVAEVAAEAVEMTAYEDFVEAQVRTGRSIFGIYPATPESRAEFEIWRAERGR